MYQLPTTGNPQTVAYNNYLSFVRSLVDLGVRGLFLLVTHVAAHSWRHSWAGLAEKALLGHLGAGAAVDWGISAPSGGLSSCSWLDQLPHMAV